MVTTVIGSYSLSNAAAVQSNGDVVVAGWSAGKTSHFTIARYDTDGSLDTTFGSGGIAGPLPLGAANGVGLQSTGKIVVYGISPPQASLVRLNIDGSLDTTFGINGVYSESRIDGFASIVIQPTDDDIVAVGGARVRPEFLGYPGACKWIVLRHSLRNQRPVRGQFPQPTRRERAHIGCPRSQRTDSGDRQHRE